MSALFCSRHSYIFVTSRTEVRLLYRTDKTDVMKNLPLSLFMTAILLMLSVIFNSSHAQSITGRVTDENNEPLAYANVIMQRADSTFIAGTIADTTGTFMLAANPEAVRLQVSFVSYITEYMEITGTDCGTIMMTPDAEMLGKAVVKATLPKTEIVGDAFVTKIENSILSEAGSANDVLKRLPGVILKNGSIEVFGKGAPIIYINGRLVRDNSELEILGSNQIKSVEVVQNPGARYDATVNAVIRIKTIKREGEGFGFNLRSSWWQSQNTDLQESVNMNYRHKGFDVFSSISYNKTESFQDTEITQRLYSENPLVLQQSALFAHKSSGLTTALGVNYQISSDHFIGIRYRPHIGLMTEDNNDSYTTATVGGVLDDRTHTLSLGQDRISPTHYVNMYYNGTIDKLNIDFNADFHDSRSAKDQVYDEISEYQDSRVVNTSSRIHNRLYASKLIFTYPLLGGTMTAGAEYSYTYRKDDYINEEGYVPSAFSTIQEDNANAFLEYVRPLKFGSFSAGLRYEYLAFYYFENDIFKEDQSRTFSNLYPSASFNAKAGQFQFQLSYAVKTVRPTYDRLTNAILYIDRYSYTKGNLYLVPEIKHDLSFAAVWKYIQFAASYKVDQRAILHWCTAAEGAGDCIMLNYLNFEKNIPELQAMVSASPTIAFWYPRMTAGFLKQWLKIDHLGQETDMSRPIPFVVVGNSFKIPKGFTASLDYNFTGPGNQRVYQLMKSTHMLDVSIRKTFLNEALSVEVRGVDLLNQRGDKVKVINGSYDLDQSNQFDSREFVLTLRYKFNSTNSKYKGTGAGDQQRNRM